MTINVLQVAYHRNGIGGEGFYAVLFEDAESAAANGIGSPRFVAAVFDGPGRVAVLAVEPLVTDVGVRFGPNSWRGDHFEPILRAAIQEHERTGRYAAGSLRAGPFSLPIE